MQRFSQSPSPVTPGKKVTICYDFSSLSINTATAVMAWDPVGTQPRSLEFRNDDEHRCVTFTVPVGVIDCIIVDDTGNSEDFALDLI